MRTDTAFDTNVLLYIAADGAKSDGAAQLLAVGGVVSPLVLTEAAHVVRRKWRWDWPATNALLGTIRANTICPPLTDEVEARGMWYAERYQLQVFDAAIVASAVFAGCHTVWSEDMHDGLLIDGLTVRNPFRV